MRYETTARVYLSWHHNLIILCEARISCVSTFFFIRRIFEISQRWKMMDRKYMEFVNRSREIAWQMANVSDRGEVQLNRFPLPCTFSTMHYLCSSTISYTRRIHKRVQRNVSNYRCELEAKTCDRSQWVHEREIQPNSCRSGARTFHFIPLYYSPMYGHVSRNDTKLWASAWATGRMMVMTWIMLFRIQTEFAKLFSTL